MGEKKRRKALSNLPLTHFRLILDTQKSDFKYQITSDPSLKNPKPNFILRSGPRKKITLWSSYIPMNDWVFFQIRHYTKEIQMRTHFKDIFQKYLVSRIFFKEEEKKIPAKKFLKSKYFFDG